MDSSWTLGQIERILCQLNEQFMPFKSYCFADLGNGMQLLGKGASANVYEGFSRKNPRKRYAIKVMGFGSKHIDSASFKMTVGAQKELAEFDNNNIIRIYDSTELRVWIDDDDNVVKAISKDNSIETLTEGDHYLDLQFIVMEEAVPVLQQDDYHKQHLFPESLAEYDEKEILKLAYDIGTALRKAHDNKVIHRDVKLENIFFSEKGHHYKLGDFGIAAKTEDGMASTVAFTKGYGAPEIVYSLEDKYDNTADIYSFGMVLYVLLNELRFPDSNNYHVNLNMQYTQGYILPEPLHGSDQFVLIVEKMCRFSPDDRYQSMDEVLKDIDRIHLGWGIRYFRDNMPTTMVMATAVYFMGIFTLAISYRPELHIKVGFWMCIFLSLGLLKGLLKRHGKQSTWTSTFMLAIGLYLTFSIGAVWWKFVVLFFIVFIDYFAALMSGGFIIFYLTSLLDQRIGLESWLGFGDIRWIAIALLSMSFFLYYQYLFFEARIETERDHKFYGIASYCYWGIAALFYVDMIMVNYQLKIPIAREWHLHLLGERAAKWILSVNIGKAGRAGLIFCCIWFIHEIVSIGVEKLKGKAISRQKIRSDI